jgi:SAM-dependent methyltransferase
VPRLPWYQSAFGADYLDLYQHRSTEEAKTTVQWILEAIRLDPPARILDLACGASRHAQEFAHLGYTVVGLDLSWSLLCCGVLKKEASGSLSLLRGDMRNLPVNSDRFDLVTSLFTSFGYFDSLTEDLTVLREIARALKTGGRLVLDFLNAARVRESLVAAEEKDIPGCRINFQRWIDETSRRVEKIITIYEPDGVSRCFRESVRLYDHSELELMLREAGLTPGRAFGSYQGALFEASSPRLIIIGTKGA